MSKQPTHVCAPVGVTSAPVKSGPGRPRAYDEDKVLDAALQVFWRQGYEATSLDDLTAATGLSRSSFYAAFGSKQGVLMAALKNYSVSGLAQLQKLAELPGDQAPMAMLEALSLPKEGPRGCLMVNCIAELAPHQEDVAELGRKHLRKIEELFAKAISPDDPDAARDKACALSALAIGTLTLRKSGMPPEQVSQALQAAKGILST
ncbi:TetR/AcrR family transcriptional regulator [Roseibium limicola]|uniref:TetR/AcrR family transcriptional regulator n=1 Tax=Roseibium limicola TaxID=2816037 RepID=A0A939ENG9_9HYPH|nr:TetR/AcrR family transcriptional regulator [Roseibium limicola]MBO0345122.1 TetR/AcrR family transcriptional regulator [Roseibium limicola]